MSPDKWKRLEEIFNQAVVLPPQKRETFLDEACRGDRELRAEAENLLANDSEAEDFIEASPYVSYLEDVVEEREAEIDAYIGRKIGAFRLVREIGRGGMGAVFLAERADREFEQKVAIKLIKRGAASVAISPTSPSAFVVRSISLRAMSMAIFPTLGFHQTQRRWIFMPGLRHIWVAHGLLLTPAITNPELGAL